MTAPRLEVDLDKIGHNARTLVERLGHRGIGVTGVTKAALGSPLLATALVRAGVTGLGDSRIENLEAMRAAGLNAPMTLLRSPMLSQAGRVVAQVDTSLNTELEVIKALGHEAHRARRTHGVVLMVELGDLREGIMPDDLEHAVEATLSFARIALRGIGTNLACHSGVAPDAAKMGLLSELANNIEAKFGIALDVVSGGNSANLDWALSDQQTGRINDLRLGESILLGREPLHRQPIEGLHTDAMTLVAEVIESKIKPSQPWGEIGQTAFGDKPAVAARAETVRALLAIGRQDTDPSGLVAGSGLEILGASSDHLIVNSGEHRLSLGTEVSFDVNYSALVRAMTSSFVAKEFLSAAPPRRAASERTSA